jgi:hypothetical protein
MNRVTNLTPQHTHTYTSTWSDVCDVSCGVISAVGMFRGDRKRGGQAARIDQEAMQP